MDRSSTNMIVSGSGYPSSTTSLPQASQPQREIPAKLELIDKLLHELSEEALGMNGTFASVLAVAPAAQTNGAPKPSHATQIADTLDSFATRIQQATSTLRDIRSRCEL